MKRTASGYPDLFWIYEAEQPNNAKQLKVAILKRIIQRQQNGNRNEG